MIFRIKLALFLVIFCTISVVRAQDDPGVYTIKNAKINTDYSDFGTAFYGPDKVVFAAPKNGFVMSKEEYKGQPFLDLYVGQVTDDGQIIKKQRIPGDINSKFHEGVVCFSKDMKTVYFSANGKIKKKKKGDKIKSTVNIQLFKATIDENGDWSNIESLPFNSEKFSTGHPILNKDDSKLYFVSDRPGTIGRTDIYVVDVYEDGSYGEPRNLGPEINTPEREMFPFIGKDNVLYFSSDGYAGYGELDVYASKIFDSTVSIPMNLGTPVNSEMDDFAYIIDDTKHKGYFSSNREGGSGDDDIYSFTASPPIYIECQQEIIGVVKNIDTQELIPNAEIILFDEQGEQLQSILSDANDASFNFTPNCDGNYTIRGYLEGYLIGEMDITTVNDLKAEPLNLVFELTKDPTYNTPVLAEASSEKMLQTSDGATESEVEQIGQSKEVENSIVQNEISTNTEASNAASAVALTQSDVQRKKNTIESGTDQELSRVDPDQQTIEVVNAEEASRGFDKESGSEPDSKQENELKNSVDEPLIAAQTSTDKEKETSVEKPSESPGNKSLALKDDSSVAVDPGDPNSAAKIQIEGFDINTIYFDFDKFNIRADARVELEKIAVLLKEYPDVKVKVNSHTDIRGKDKYNYVLSDKRAKSTMAYLKDKGVEQERLIGKGHGEDQLAENCDHNLPCTSFQHQLNRRSEFVFFRNMNDVIAYSINRTTADIKKGGVETAFSNYNFNGDTEVWTVQIGAFKKRVDMKKFAKLDNVFNNSYNDGFNRYFAGVFTTTRQAQAYMKQMRQNGFEGAFVVGLKGQDRFFRKK